MSWAVLGNLGLAMCQWGVVSVIAKGGGTTAVGTFTLATALVAPLLALSQVQLRAVLGTDVARARPFATYLRLRAAATVALILMAPFVALVGGHKGQVVVIVTVFAFAKAFDSIADIYFGYQQRRNGLRFISVGQLLNGTLSLLMATIALLLTHDLLFTIVAYAVGSALSLFGWTLPKTRSLVRSEEPDASSSVGDVLDLLREAAPLGLVMLLAALGANIPRYAVESIEGREALGIFGAISFVVLIGANVAAAIGAAFSPRLAAAAAAGDRAGFRRMFGHLLLLCAALGVGGAGLSALTGDVVLEVVYTAEIAQNQGLLVLLALASVLTFVATGTSVAVTAMRRFQAQVPVLLAAVFGGAVSAYFGVRGWGLSGAALGVAVTGAVQTLGGVLTLHSAERHMKEAG